MASAYIERDNAWIAKGEDERALADFDLAIASDPGHAGAYYNRAVTRYRLKDYERALADFTRAIQLNPHYIEAYVDRGGAHTAGRTGFRQMPDTEQKPEAVSLPAHRGG